MINAFQAAELASRPKTVPEKIQQKLEAKIKLAARDGHSSVEIEFYDVDDDMSNRIVEFLKGLGYGVKSRFLFGPRSDDGVRMFKVTWSPPSACR